MKNEPPLDIVLVTFESLEQSSKVYHSFHYNYKWSNCFAKSDESDLLKPQKWRVSYAPPPWDIYWENLTNFEAIWWFKIIVFHVVVLMFVVLVTTPKSYVPRGKLGRFWPGTFLVFIDERLFTVR